MESLVQGRGFPKYRPPGQATGVFYVLPDVPPAVRTTRRSGWTAERDALTLYEEMKPVMIVLRILGVLPYGVTSTGNTNLTIHLFHACTYLASLPIFLL
jgi:hypothetical protein